VDGKLDLLYNTFATEEKKGVWEEEPEKRGMKYKFFEG